MTTALILIALGVATRLAPHPANMVPLAAVALYAAARLPKRWAFVVPLAAMLLSDLALDLNSGWTTPLATRATIYGTFALIVALGRLPGREAGPIVRGALAVGGSTLFFLTTNLAVWATGEIGYPRTGAGLITCYVAALPFYGNALVADLAGTAALFGLDALARRVGDRLSRGEKRSAPSLAADLD